MDSLLDFIIAIIKIIGVTFIMFNIAYSKLNAWGFVKPRLWFFLIFTLSLSVMLIYRLLGVDVSLPFYTVLAFTFWPLNGLSSNYDDPEKTIVEHLTKPAIYASLIGCFLGWMSYAEFDTTLIQR